MTELWLHAPVTDDDVVAVPWSLPEVEPQVRPAFVNPDAPPMDGPPDAPFSPEPPIPTEKSLAPAPATEEIPPTEEEPGAPDELVQQLEEQQQQWERQLALLANGLNELSRLGRQALQHTTDEIVEFGLGVAGELAGGALQVAPERVLALVTEAIALLGDAAAAKVRLHPDLYERLDESGQLERDDEVPAVQFVSDPAVGDLGCIVEAGRIRVDARVMSRLNRLRYLFESQPEPPEEG